MRPSSRTLGSIAAAAALAAVTPITQAALITSAGHAALAGASLIDFEGRGSFRACNFSVGSVSFHGDSWRDLSNNLVCPGLNVGAYAEAGWPQAGHALQTRHAENGAFTISFGDVGDGGVTAFGLDLFSVGSPYTMTLYGNSGRLLSTLVGPNHDGRFYGASSDVPIALAVFRTRDFVGEWLLADNLRYVAYTAPVPDPDPTPPPPPPPPPDPGTGGVNAVPAPGSLVLVVTALAGLMQWRPRAGSSLQRRRLQTHLG